MEKKKRKKKREKERKKRLRGEERGSVSLSKLYFSLLEGPNSYPPESWNCIRFPSQLRGPPGNFVEWGGIENL